MKCLLCYIVFQSLEHSSPDTTTSTFHIYKMDENLFGHRLQAPTLWSSTGAPASAVGMRVVTALRGKVFDASHNGEVS